MGNAATERQRKLRMLQTFKAEVEADEKLPAARGVFYQPTRAGSDPQNCWPHRGGRKYRHFYIERPDGTDHLISAPNQPFGNIDMQTSAGPINVYVNKGYREVSGAELMAIVERQQARTIKMLDDAVAAEEAAQAVPVAAVEVSRGRRRNVKRLA